MNRKAWWRAGLLAVLALGIGCGRETTPSGGTRGGPVTFARDVAPILYQNCVPCHRTGGAGPFSLVTYPDAARRARLIASVTSRRQMPPWMPEPGVGSFEGERRLGAEQIATLAQWAAAGAPEGDPAQLPPIPVFTEGWQLGKPDLVVRIAEPIAVPAEGPDVFQSVRIPTALAQTRYVRALEFRQGGTHVVHHAMIRLAKGAGATTGALGEPALGGMLFDSTEAVSPDGHVLGWAPGYSPYRAPAGMPWTLKAGIDLLLELHLQPDGLAQQVQPEIGLFFTDEPPTRAPIGIQLGSFTIDIPPGQREYAIEDRYTLPVDVDVYTIYPHAHYLGKDLRAFATLPDGTRRDLIWIKDWDFNWQNAYRLAEPMFLPKGTTVAMRYVYDNSAENPRNPRKPPVRVRYGGQSSDEMGNFWMQVVPRRPEERAQLERDYAVKAASRIVSAYEEARQAAPNPAGVERAVGTAYLQMGRVDEALRHLERAIALDPREPSAHYNLGHAQAAQGRYREAEASFRRAAGLNPAFGDAQNNLGEMLRARGAVDEAIVAYRAAIAAAPGVPLFHANLGTALATQGRIEAAVSEYEAALKIEPRSPDALFGLARVAHAQSRVADAAAYYRRTIEAAPDHADACNALAWLLATAEGARAADVEEAMTLAAKAVELTRRQDASALDTLAAAYAASRDFERAAAASRAAADLALRRGQHNLARQIEKRTALYRRGQPYRER